MLNESLLINRSHRVFTICLLLWSILGLGCASAGRDSIPIQSFSALFSTSLTSDAPPTATGNLNNQESNTAQITGSAVVISIRANLREGPGASRNVILEVEKDDALNLASRKRRGQWYNVIHAASGKTGWINGNSIKLLDAQRNTPAQAARESPSTTTTSSPRISAPVTSSPKRPAPSRTAPSGASAICRDGTYSYSQNRRGTCSHHGGVAEWL